MVPVADGDLLVNEEVKVNTDDGDHDKFSHYVLKAAQLEGILRIAPAVALCGKVWYPDEIDNTPEKRTVCPGCKEIYETLEQR